MIYGEFTLPKLGHLHVAYYTTDEEFVNAVFDPQEQVNGKQAELLGAVFTLAAGGPAEVHVGTGTGGSSSDLPWNDNVAKKHTSIKRR